MYSKICLPANTNNIPHTKVKFFFPELQCPTKHIMVPIIRINRLAKGNHVALLIVTASISRTLD